MAAIDFPDNPTIGQEFLVDGRSWTWSGTTWDAVLETADIPLFATVPLSFNSLTRTISIDLSNYATTADISNFVIESDIDTKISTAVSGLVDSAPTTLDTLNELAAALSDDADFANTVANQIAGKADASHTHAISDVNNLQTELNGKSDTGHGHNISDVNNLQTELNGKSDTDHTHPISDVNNLQTALNTKQEDVITTQGDLIIGDASGNASRIGVGSADQVLTSNGTSPVWADAAGGGSSWNLVGSYTVPNGVNLITLNGISDSGSYFIEFQDITVSGDAQIYLSFRRSGQASLLFKYLVRFDGERENVQGTTTSPLIAEVGAGNSFYGVLSLQSGDTGGTLVELSGGPRGNTNKYSTYGKSLLDGKPDFIELGSFSPNMTGGTYLVWEAT